MKHVHFVGIKGVGMVPLAIIAKQAGFRVTGCDVDEKFITDAALEKENIIPFVGFNQKHIENADLVITTGAHGGLANEEVMSAQQKGKEVLTQGQAVGKFMEGKIFNRKFKGISIAGCHGKTTTTSMIATILSNLNFDPSYIIGTSEIPSLKAAGHYGKGEYFVAEADEYATDPILDKTPKFLWQHPYILAITNIDFDHPDIYTSINQVENMYMKFIHNVSDGGFIVVNGDDVHSKKIIKGFTKLCIRYGKNKNNDYYFNNMIHANYGMSFDIFCKGKKLGKIELILSGEHNALNALAAYGVCSLLGLHFQDIKEGLKAFKGTKRRMEYKGQLKSGAHVYDDYAHHPNEIKTSLEGLKLRYPDKKIVCIFQPHTFSRTKILFDKFKYSFSDADKIIVCDIYSSKREKKDETINSEKLVRSMLGEVIYISTLNKIVEFINKDSFGPDTILITMGAGDIYKVWDNVNLKR